MSSPLVSVIIPIYNAEKYLHETIDSVLNQSYENFELILVNHNSQDKSSFIINEYKVKDKRIIVKNLSLNKGGPAYPRNEGLKIASGEYVAFLDSDDVWLEDKLEKQVEFMKHNDCDIVHTLAYMIDEKSTLIGHSNNQKVYNLLKYLLPLNIIILFTNFININTVLMKKDVEIFFKEDTFLIALEDLYFWINNIFSEKKVLLLNEKLINYRVLKNSASDRSSDKSFRKLYYMYSLLLNEKKISLKVFIFCFFVNTLKLSIRNMKNIINKSKT